MGRERSPEDNPGDRWSDELGGWKKIPVWIWHHKLYRDVWLIIISFVLWGAVQANQDRVDDIQSSRIEATRNSCDKGNELIRSNNASLQTIQRQVVGGDVLPGDIPQPAGEADPLKWKTVKSGGLTKQIQNTYPDFPSANTRLKLAKQRAKSLEANLIKVRNCDDEVRAIADQNG